jgi:glycosyltransferase involved in cell wall biosynthesis
MIARNEAGNVRACFESFWDHVDEVVLCDTGSRDGTIGEARAFARERGEAGKLIVCRFKWCDDFAAARHHAHSHATGEVHLRIDLDERLEGGENVRHEVVPLFDEHAELRYVCIQSFGSSVVPDMWLSRFFRRPTGWSHPVWERPDVPSDPVDPAILDADGEWPADVPGWPIHTRSLSAVRLRHTRSTHRGRRDLDIALKWIDRETGSVVAFLVAAREASVNGEFELMDRLCERALRCEDLALEFKASLLRLRAAAKYALYDYTQGQRLAKQAIRAGMDAYRSCAKYKLVNFNALDAVCESWWMLGAHALQTGDCDEALSCARKASEAAMTPSAQQRAARLAAAAGARRQQDAVSGYGRLGGLGLTPVGSENVIQACGFDSRDAR